MGFCIRKSFLHKLYWDKFEIGFRNINSDMSGNQVKSQLRMLKLERRKARREAMKECLQVLPEDWQNRPAGLKGRDIGIWYSQRQKLMNKMINLPNDLNYQSSKESKKNKKEKIGKLEDKSSFDLCLDSEQQELISQYLSSVSDVPPASLAAQFKMLKSIRVDSPNVPESSVGATEKRDLTVSPTTEVTSKHFKRIENEPSLWNKQEWFHDDCTSTFNSNNIDEVKNEKELNNSNPNKEYDGRQRDVTDEGFSYWLCGGAVQQPSNSDTVPLKILSAPESLSSVDKYKYLEDTPFKTQFLKVLTGTIEENLEKSLLSDNKLWRNSRLDNMLIHELNSKRYNSLYKKMSAARRKLPAFKMQADILYMIRYSQVVLISGETGCGKTTQVAQFILDEAIMSGNGSLCNILCTQPRRISAISVAQRVAQERGEAVGEKSVGYQIRLDKKLARPRGSILFCTTGILIQHMQGDPSLTKYSHIVLDEIHERDTICDFALTILRDVIKKRTDLKVILMSATLNAEQFSEYFNNCPIIHIPGYTFPVTEYYLEDVLSMTQFVPDLKKGRKRDDKTFNTFVLPYINELKKSKQYPECVLDFLRKPDSEEINPDLILGLLDYICENEGPGAILIFAPGWDDISTIHKAISTSPDFPESLFVVIPLHSMMPTIHQQSVFNRPPPGVRKIIIATNIAETSITIDDVVFVIDTGKIKIKNFDVVNNISTLKPEWVSLANSRQRRGRAGRVQPGFCYHLYTRGRERTFSDYPLPEMLRTKLEEVVLNVKILQLGHALPFLEKVLNPPNPRAVTLALELLVKLNALDENENLTPLGYHLAKLPLDPQIGKMLLMGVIMSCLDPILSIAATLSFKDPFYCTLGNEKMVNERKIELDKGLRSDHLLMAEVMKQWEREESRGGGPSFCHRNFLTRRTLFSLRDQKQQFARYLYELGFMQSMEYKRKNLNINSENVALIKAVVCSGLYPNIAIIKRIGQKKNFTVLETPEDGKVSFHPKSVNAIQKDFEGVFFVYHEKLRSSCTFIHDATMIHCLPMLFFGHGFDLMLQKDKVIIELKPGLRFTCKKNVANLITELRFRLDWLLEYKLSHPGQITWDGNNTEAALLRALIEVITCKDNQMMKVGQNKDSDSSSEE